MPQRVLIVEDDEALAQLLVLRCGELGLEAEAASDGLEALVWGLRNPPDLFIVDYRMPGADGLTLCEKLVKDVKLKSIPVIVLTGAADEAVIARCGELGVQYCYKGLEAWQDLKRMISQTLGLKGEVKPFPERGKTADAAGSSAAPKVLLVDDNPHVTQAMAIRLEALGLRTIRTSDAYEAESLAQSERPDVIVTDFHMPGMSGDKLLRNLQKSPLTAKIPVIVITGDNIDGQPNFSLRQDFLDRWGAAAYVDKPLDFDAFVEELSHHVTIPKQPTVIAAAP